MNPTFFFHAFAGLALSISAPVVPEATPCWAAKEYGKPHGGGDSFACQRTSPRFVKTRHGCMKRKKRS